MDFQSSKEFWPGPAPVYYNAPILSMALLVHLLEKSHMELRTKILGYNASVSRSGFIDTKNGYVVTSPRALKLAIAKSEDRQKEARGRGSRAH